MANIVKILNSYATQEVYETLYFFWLGIGIDNLSEKLRLSEEKKKENSFQNRLRKEGELSLIEQQLSFINTKIEELNVQKSTFSINENYTEDVEKLNQTKYNLNQLSSNLSALEIRRNLILESKTDLEKEYARIDVSQIRRLYEKAKILVPSLQTSFEDTVKFHNDLLSEKINYITKELPDLQKSITEHRYQLSKFIALEKALTDKLTKLGITEDLEAIVMELNKFFEKKGTLEEQKKLWSNSNERLKNITNTLNDINQEIISKDELIQNRITEFNKFFSEISNELYGEYYILSSSTNEKGYDLIITNIEGNPSTGKKKGQIAAFDFAYIQFADHLDINCLHFIMHDQLENIHDNQLNTLIEVANCINGQYIVPILRDKIPPNVDVSLYEALSLSQGDKLFKI
jgi:phage shock protein A